GTGMLTERACGSVARRCGAGEGVSARTEVPKASSADASASAALAVRTAGGDENRGVGGIDVRSGGRYVAAVGRVAGSIDCRRHAGSERILLRLGVVLVEEVRGFDPRRLDAMVPHRCAEVGRESDRRSDRYGDPRTPGPEALEKRGLL